MLINIVAMDMLKSKIPPGTIKTDTVYHLELTSQKKIVSLAFHCVKNHGSGNLKKPRNLVYQLIPFK
jgi:hypothetical protein